MCGVCSSLLILIRGALLLIKDALYWVLLMRKGMFMLKLININGRAACSLVLMRGQGTCMYGRVGSEWRLFNIN